MGTSGSPGYRARQREREQQRRRQFERARTEEAPTGSPDTGVDGPNGRTAATTCGWCGGPITPRSRGPIPKWCSATCRHRAWEQTRAAASGHAAIQVLERRVEIPTPVAPLAGTGRRLLGELAHQLDDGRVYDRDLPELTAALSAVLAAYSRRPYVRDRRSQRHAALPPVATPRRESSCPGARSRRLFRGAISYFCSSTAALQGAHGICADRPGSTGEGPESATGDELQAGLAAWRLTLPTSGEA